MVRDVGEWLKGLKLGQYAQAFADSDIEQDLLIELSEDDLQNLGVRSLGHRKRLMRAIRALSAETRGKDRSAPKSSPAPHTGGRGEADWNLAVRGGGEQVRQLTVMFVDLVDSTALSEKLDLEDYWAMIASYQLCCTDVIADFHGFVARYLGDGVLAYFGYPRAAEDDAERAVAAGLNIAGAVSNVENERGIQLAARIGIATGRVLISDLAKGRLEIKDEVLGGAPNLAARLQSLAKPGTVVVSESTRVLLGKNFECADMGSLRLKGFSKAVSVWQARKVHLTASRFESRQKGPMTPFIGRDEELDLIQKRWRSVTRGNGRVVLISGEAGIGKSRLVRLHCDQLMSEPHIRLRYQCSPYHTRSALYPVITQLTYAAGIRHEDTNQEKLDKLETLLGRAVDNVKEVAPLFSRLLSIPDEGRYRPLDESAETIKERTKIALLDQVFGLAKTKPTVVVFEDIHWIDPSTEEMLGALIDQTESRRIQVLCTYRPEYEPSWTGQAGVSTLRLNRLDHRQSLQMIGRLCSDRGILSELTEAIASKAEGVPLFIEELTKTVLESDRMAAEPGDEAGGKGATSLALPSTLNDLLMAKLDSLSGTNDVVQTCAAIGRTFSYRIIAMVSGLADGTLRAILDKLIRAQILLQRGQWPDAIYSFRHALIQEAAYSTMLKSRVNSLHARIAETLATQLPEYAAQNPEIVAYHYARAAMPKQARDFWASAGDVAIERLAYLEAIAHLEAALQENAKLDDRHDRLTTEIALREKLVIPLEARFWGSDDIASNFSRLHELQSKYGDDKDRFAVLDGLYGTHIIGDKPDLALEYASKMLEIAETQDNAAFSMMSQHAMGMCHFAMGDFDKATRHYTLAIQLRPRSSRELMGNYYLADVEIIDLCMQSWAYALSGKRTLAKRTIERARKITEATEHKFSRAYGFSILASVHQSTGDAAICLEYASRARELSERHHFRYWAAWAQIMQGWATVASGDNRGIEGLTAGLDSYVNTGSKQIVAYAKTLLADAYLRAGRILSGLSVIEEVESADQNSPVRFHRPIAERVARELRDASEAAQGGAGP